MSHKFPGVITHTFVLSCLKWGKSGRSLVANHKQPIESRCIDFLTLKRFGRTPVESNTWGVSRATMWVEGLKAGKTAQTRGQFFIVLVVLCQTSQVVTLSCDTLYRNTPSVVEGFMVSRFLKCTMKV